MILLFKVLQVQKNMTIIEIKKELRFLHLSTVWRSLINMKTAKIFKIFSS